MQKIARKIMTTVLIVVTLVAVNLGTSNKVEAAETNDAAEIIAATAIVLSTIAIMNQATDSHMPVVKPRPMRKPLPAFRQPVFLPPPSHHHHKQMHQHPHRKRW